MVRKVFTTGSVAKVCKVSSKTVCDWFKQGLLKGYLVPGGIERRFPRESLIEFLKQWGQVDSLKELEEELDTILVVGASDRLLAQLQELLPANDEMRYAFANDAFESGLRVQEFRPDVIIMDLAMGCSECISMVKRLRRHPFHSGSLVVALVAEDQPEEKLWEIRENGFNEAIKKPFNTTVLVEVIQRFIMERETRKEAVKPKGIPRKKKKQVAKEAMLRV